MEFVVYGELLGWSLPTLFLPVCFERFYCDYAKWQLNSMTDVIWGSVVNLPIHLK
jgi:hypothetical protein